LSFTHIILLNMGNIPDSESTGNGSIKSLTGQQH